jgi:hypothetical protein
MKPVNIVCMKWKRENGADKFGPEYVNRLHNMVKKNLTIPHRFVCFTDDSTGFDAEIESFPLPPVKLRGGLPERGWKKLGILSKKLGDLTGTALFLDLDIAVVGNIDGLFKLPGEFIVARDKQGNEVEGNSSVFRFEVGKHQDILDFFEKNFEDIRKEVRREQQFLSNEMTKKGIFQFWPDNWCMSFKYNVMLPFPINWFVTPKIPKGAKVVIFHGRPTPVAAREGYTAKFGLRRVRPLKWLDEVWKR